MSEETTLPPEAETKPASLPTIEEIVLKIAEQDKLLRTVVNELQSTQRVLFLLMAERRFDFPIPQNMQKGKMYTMPVPSGFFVSFAKGDEVGGIMLPPSMMRANGKKH